MPTIMSRYMAQACVHSGVTLGQDNTFRHHSGTITSKITLINLYGSDSSGNELKLTIRARVWVLLWSGTKQTPES